MKKILLTQISIIIFWVYIQEANSQTLPQLGKSSIKEVISAMTLE